MIHEPLIVFSPNPSTKIRKDAQKAMHLLCKHSNMKTTKQFVLCSFILSLMVGRFQNILNNTPVNNHQNGKQL
jgi:hypothetical protein